MITEFIKDRKVLNIALLLYAVFLVYKIGAEAVNLARHKSALDKIK